VTNCYIEPAKAELGRPFCYKSEGLARRLGLKNLYIAFSGYWPERGAMLLTRTFKEFECQTSVVRYLACLGDKNPLPLLVASAGNTANGYNLMTHLLQLPLYLVIPESGLEKLVLPFETNPYVVVVDGDYTDAIKASEKIAHYTGLTKDGGVYNVARRAGLSTVMLNAVMHPQQGSHELFDHYFQAVGSSAGAIAAWEAVELLLSDGRFGNKVTKIHMAQNHPSTPIVDAWNAGSKDLIFAQETQAKAEVEAVTADVLTNRRPPYATAGGIFDVLTKSQGSTWKVKNFQVFQSARMFRETEGVDLGPAAAVAVSSLAQAVGSGCVRSEEKILLHITGGGREIQYSEDSMYWARPSLCVKLEELDRVIHKIKIPQPICNAQTMLKHLSPAGDKRTKTRISI
jgi:cysteate synthase